MKTKIFACFPETGKTYACRMHSDKVTELNSKFYYFTEDHEYLFHEKYIRDLEKLIGTVEIILIDTNLKILDELNKKGIEFSYILPDSKMLDQIMIDHNEYGKRKLIDLYNKLCTSYVHFDHYLDSTNGRKSLITNENVKGSEGQFAQLVKLSTTDIKLSEVYFLKKGESVNINKEKNNLV